MALALWLIIACPVSGVEWGPEKEYQNPKLVLKFLGLPK